MNLFEMTILSKAGVIPNDEVAPAVVAWATFIEMTQVAEDAVLWQKDVGAFGHDLRASIVARVAHLSRDPTLAERNLADAADFEPLADPKESGEARGLGAVLAVGDRVANQTRDAAAKDISGLQLSGLSDADIVRLCESLAFMAFQIRVIASLRLMRQEVA